MSPKPPIIQHVYDNTKSMLTDFTLTSFPPPYSEKPEPLDAWSVMKSELYETMAQLQQSVHDTQMMIEKMHTRFSSLDDSDDLIRQLNQSLEDMITEAQMSLESPIPFESRHTPHDRYFPFTNDENENDHHSQQISRSTAIEKRHQKYLASQERLNATITKLMDAIQDASPTACAVELLRLTDAPRLAKLPHTIIQYYKSSLQAASSLLHCIPAPSPYFRLKPSEYYASYSICHESSTDGYAA
ncbi:uncharacterized protein BYT42DRAFT_612636 [Radiomyces spectabilis]|uniref:uncharacterized protein n=1 Tax=Radiomyces spectabilis TaxID=64574 RepID=UPI002220EAC9|nr:uncharacterized protein BYT42DRAFT_612636 [Radiomyces spectabilis]KAI8384978.1 hypothetical protein BYT42DRAFT_612636 [Radiomyces spectabilis]